MVGLCLKFGGTRLIRSMLNKAKFRVEEIQENKKEQERKKNKLSLGELKPYELSWI